MTWSAPARAARCPFSGPLTVVITVASDHRASWIAALPTAPAPPATRTVRPSSVPGPSRVGPSSVTVRHRWAVRKGTPRLAPRSNDATSGSSTTWRAGTTAYSCAVPPAGRRCAASQIQTRRPTRADSTPCPTASTTPEPSWFGTCGGSTAAPGACAATGLPVGRVDAGAVDPDPHLPRPGIGHRPLDQAQDVWVTGDGVLDRAHAPDGIPRRWRRHRGARRAGDGWGRGSAVLTDDWTARRESSLRQQT